MVQFIMHLWAENAKITFSALKGYFNIAIYLLPSFGFGLDWFTDIVLSGSLVCLNV